MKTTLEDFGTSLEELREAEQAGEQLEQNHFGDFLMIETDRDQLPRYRVWLNHPENVAQGESAWEIEYFGDANGYTWTTVGQGNH